MRDLKLQQNSVSTSSDTCQLNIDTFKLNEDGCCVSVIPLYNMKPWVEHKLSLNLDMGPPLWYNRLKS